MFTIVVTLLVFQLRDLVPITDLLIYVIVPNPKSPPNAVVNNKVVSLVILAILLEYTTNGV